MPLYLIDQLCLVYQITARGVILKCRHTLSQNSKNDGCRSVFQSGGRRFNSPLVKVSLSKTLNPELLLAVSSGYE